ncbi:hypothetical protein DMENIID0001_056740 [Sergentomyia squamirostris]
MNSCSHPRTHISPDNGSLFLVFGCSLALVNTPSMSAAPVCPSHQRLSTSFILVHFSHCGVGGTCCGWSLLQTFSSRMTTEEYCLRTKAITQSTIITMLPNTRHQQSHVTPNTTSCKRRSAFPSHTRHPCGRTSGWLPREFSCSVGVGVKFSKYHEEL